MSTNIAAAIAQSRQLELELPETARHYRVQFLRNYTIEGIEPFLRYALLQLGLRPHVQFGGYGTFRQDLEQIASNSQQALDAIVVCWVLEELDPDVGNPNWTSDRARTALLSLFDHLDRVSARAILVQNFIAPFVAETSAGGDSIGLGVTALNRCISEEIDKRALRFSLLDSSQLARQLGEAAALDYRFWYLAKAPYKPALLDKMATEITRVARLQCGLAKKVLVLDCDNTLWGGVIGEDGLAGIKLDRHDYPGNAFLDFQKSILRLNRRGVILALCSKNNESDVFDVLDNHASCLLRRTDISAYRINWEAKATGIREIAEQLNVGLNSVVFVDDSSHEIGLVSNALPQVTCLRTPDKHWMLPSLLARSGVFDTDVVTNEDLVRTQSYRDERERESSRADMVSLDEYLASLQIIAKITTATPEAIPRIAQLFLKTNQFNLTTRRLVAFEVEQLMTSESNAIFTMSASDRFGDLGLVGVMIAERRGTEAGVTDLLLSCRALGRGLELALASEVIRRLSLEWGITRWLAYFVPSLKNAQARDFWDRAGFTFECEDNMGKKYYLQGEPGAALPIDHVTITGGNQ